MVIERARIAVVSNNVRRENDRGGLINVTNCLSWIVRLLLYKYLIQRQSPDNNVMHAKPDLRVFFEFEIAGSGSVITDVMSL